MDEDPIALRREMDGKPAWTSEPPKRDRRGGKPAERSQFKPKAPAASPRASEVAQRWMDMAGERGLAMPFNANWLAHQIAAKVGADARMKVLLQEGRDNDAKRWAIKMVEKFWLEWVQASDKPADLSHLFLGTCWEDVRDYAFDCLRGAYLKAHGRRVPPPNSEEQDHRESGIYKDLRDARFNAWLEEAIAESGQEPAPRKTLDEHRREVLRSKRRSAVWTPPERDEDQ